MSNIGIIGWGVVGQAVGQGFAQNKNNRILWYDKFKKGSHSLEKVINHSEFIFLCLPTPMFADQSGIDLSIMNQMVAKIAPKVSGTEKIIIIKSTVIPGTTLKYSQKYPKVNFAMNPEFLTDAHAFEDFLAPDRTIIGALNKKIASRIARLYQALYHSKSRIFLTDPTSAEIVKYACNAFLATKVIFANEISDLSTIMGVKYDDVKKMIIADTRIGPTHLDVTADRGFGGKCFPKDLVALLNFAKKKNVDFTLLEKVWQKNLKIRKVRDWETINGAVSKNKHIPGKTA